MNFNFNRPHIQKVKAIILLAVVVSVTGIVSYYNGLIGNTRFAPSIPFMDTVEKYQSTDPNTLMRELLITCQNSSGCPYWAWCGVSVLAKNECKILGMKTVRQ